MCGLVIISHLISCTRTDTSKSGRLSLEDLRMEIRQLGLGGWTLGCGEYRTKDTFRLYRNAIGTAECSFRVLVTRKREVVL